MHLLKLDDHGKPVLTQFLACNIPSYAILSHTWEADDQEVTFRDLTNSIGINKLGYGNFLFSRFLLSQIRHQNKSLRNKLH
jgi:hypothetical protein